jgi:hypothetical protein
MSVELEKLRRAAAENALRRLGKGVRQPFTKAGQMAAGEYQAMIHTLPHGDVPETQIMTPGADYGKDIFLVNYHTVDNTSTVIIS